MREDERGVVLREACKGVVMSVVSRLVSCMRREART